ncbi:MAG TPA: PQQ-dependent sugar dehydrogenase [Nitrososphaeraceae archaeon]|nr:PQQ-dependent sugar dehydrogenase [Nitrososphaeraceae archaeon]
MLIAAIGLISLIPTYNIGFGQEDEEEATIPQLKDSNLNIELVSDGLESPTGMAFLGPDDILVLEKDKGTVQRIVNGEMLQEPILDVNVNSEDERGLLGIAVSKNATNDKTYVFLFYTEAKGTEDGGDPIANRLYRYELVDDKLANPKLLLDLPYLPGPAHNGGVIAIGPDSNIYVAVGELTPTKYAKEDYRFLSQNYVNGKVPDGRGGILRVTQDGQPVGGKGILGNGHPLDMYYAYGIRNSFGIAFDPVTGKLWDTENGPSWGDEINLVEPGFNSGWAKVLGIWTVNEMINEEGNREINEGQIASPVPGGLIDFNGKGQYSPPKLTWDETIAPTAIAFLDSNKLGMQYEDDMFVGTVKDRLLHFKLEEPNRTELALNGTLSDKVADTVEDIEDVTLAEGLGIITDAKVGPDGYLYIVSGARSPDGKVYRILPVTME